LNPPKTVTFAAYVDADKTNNAANVTVFGGVNNEGKIEFKDEDGTEKRDTKSGFTVGVEAHKALNKSTKNIFEEGMGVKYDSVITNKEKNEYEEDYAEYASTLPIYGSAKYTYKVNNKLGVYLQGKAGYAMAFAGKSVEDYDKYLSEVGVSAEVEGGLYTGATVGVEYGNLALGVSTDITEAKLVIKNPADEDSESDITYKKVSLTAGYKFGK
jgi:hypothetical protein